MSRRILIAIIAVCAALFVVIGSAAAYYYLGSGPGNQGTQSNQGNQATVFPKRHHKKRPTPQPTAHTGNGCGVKQNKDGTYTFSWLHVGADGAIVDQNNCIVPLAGFNIGGLFLGGAGAGTSPKSGTNPTQLQWIHQTFPSDIMRVSFNTIWWNQDVLVPRANMHYRAYLEQFVKNLEQMGNYVELDPTTNFPEPPCGGSISLCPSQNQGEMDYQNNPNANTQQESPFYIPPIVEAWKSMVPLYANDPAIIYDAWNEPVVSGNSFFNEMNTLIDTIRSLNPKALIIVFADQWSKIMSGAQPDYTQPNLAIDFHIYDGYHGISPVTGAQCDEPGKTTFSPFGNFSNITNFIHSHGQGLIINEWGGCYDLPTYHQNMISFAKQKNVSMVYWEIGVCLDYTNGNYVVNGNGQLVKTGYASLLGP